MTVTQIRGRGFSILKLQPLREMASNFAMPLLSFYAPSPLGSLFAPPLQRINILADPLLFFSVTDENLNFLSHVLALTIYQNLYIFSLDRVIPSTKKHH